MPTNQNGIVSGNKQNTPGGATSVSRSTFPLSYSMFQTERFAEYTPFFVQEGVSSDKLPLHSNHDVQTYTLKSPILQSLAKKTDYFAVPMQAILPLNWEKFYTQPNIGEDVPDDCGLGVEGFWNKMRTLFNNSWTELASRFNISGNEVNKINSLFHFLLFFENIYSPGCLMEYLGTSAHNWFRCDKTIEGPINEVVSVTFDDLFDDAMSYVALSLSQHDNIGFTIGDNNYLIVSRPLDVARSSVQQLTLREALELMRDDLSFVINAVESSTLADDIDANIMRLYMPLIPASDADFNLGRLWAYQLSVAHFFSNDHIDFIYSAELYRQYVQQLVYRQSQNAPYPTYIGTFSVNGLEYQYDALSSYCFNHVLSVFGNKGIFVYTTPSGGLGPGDLNEAFAYFIALFGFKRSLRFMDYFTGARSLPLAVGDHEVSIGSDGKLDIIDLSQKSMFTKFLQAVNRSGRKFSAYMQELFHKTPAYDYHNPMFLAHSSDLVGAPETENTGAGQLDPNRDIAVTTRFKATASRFAFEFTPDRDCIVIGITYYDIPRVYTRATERQNFIVNRFDMFNTYLQYTGDQAIMQAEIGTDTPLKAAFAYQNKDMQYKQRYNQAAGGFCVPSTDLNTWIFEADTLRRKFVHNISPSFIRSFNSEIDRFYQRLTGYSLGTYFHFIVRYDNRMDASRPMAYNPTIVI